MDITPIMENRTEKTMEHEVEIWLIQWFIRIRALEVSFFIFEIWGKIC